MGEPFVAFTQYNDLKGTAAFDGHDGPPLFELVEKTDMPKEGYWPVGFEFFRLHPDETGNIPFTLVAVKCEETGHKIEDVIEYASKANELPVYRFDGALRPDDFGYLFKRIDIKVVQKELKHANIVASRPPEQNEIG